MNNYTNELTRNRKHKKKIKFDDELIANNVTVPSIKESGNRRHKKKIKFDDELITNNVTVPSIKESDTVKPSKKLRKTNSNTEFPICVPHSKSLDESNISKGDDLVEKEESIRARKRKKHLGLLHEKKVHYEINLQQKCLNYLSTWKNNKSQWKFEKLKQIWLQQNMFDNVKVPDDIWETLIEYFESAKGQVKSNILSSAVKIVENIQTEENTLQDEDVKYIRARQIIQNLQE